MKYHLLAAFALLSLIASSQCSLIEIPLQQRTSRSELIIEGRIIDQNSFWNTSRNMIYTSHTIEVYKIFKGNLTGELVELITPGGVVGLNMIRVEPSLTPNLNETGIFLLQSPTSVKNLPAGSLPRYEAYASLQGFIKYDQQLGTASDPFDTYGSIDALYKELSVAPYKKIKNLQLPSIQPMGKLMAIDGFSPATITSGTGAVLTINGSGFGATRGTGEVRFRDANSGGSSLIAPLATQYISWTDTEIQVEVPSRAGTGTFQVVQGATTFTSAAALNISYSHINVSYDPGAGVTAYQTRHADINGTGGYVWQMNTAFDANASANSSFMRAFDTWRCGTGVNWTIGPTTALDVAISDDVNIITFDDNDPLPAGVLGTCYSYFGGCSDGINIYWVVTELDIIFDEGSNITPLTWEYGTATPTGSEFDFETVAVHELGHGHQLGHVISPGAIMHYAIANGSSNRALGVTDLAGGNFVQIKSEAGAVCGVPAMTAYTGCSVLPITLSFINASAHLNGIMVEWINSHETGVDHYELEESGNGMEFSFVASHHPSMNNGSQAAYQHFDQAVYNGNNFYRVKSIAQTGEVKYSEVVKVNISNGREAFHVYPNPVKGNTLMLQLNGLAKGKYEMQVYNATGQLVHDMQIIHDGGSSTRTVNLPVLAKGWYAFRLNGGEHLLEQRLMVE